MSDPFRTGLIAGLPVGTFSGLFRAIDGLRNLRAFVAMLGCMALGVLVAGIFSLLATRLGVVFGFLGGLAIFGATATGANAAGVLLMDQARGLPLRSLHDAVVDGLAGIPKFILLVLVLLIAALVVFVAITLAYLACRTPVLGPLLFVLVFPLSVMLAGLTCCGLFLCLFLALPAIWEGASILRALTQALAIARVRLVESLLMLLGVGLLAAVVGLVVFGVLFTGLVPTVTMAATIFGGDAIGSLLSTAHWGDGFGAGGYGLAAGVGGMLLWALTGTLSSLVYLLGLGIVYLRMTDGLPLQATEAALRAWWDGARRQAGEVGVRARDAAQRARDGVGRAAEAPRADDPATAAVPNSAKRPATQSAAPATTLPALRARADAPPAAPRPPRAAPPDSTSPAVAKALTCPQCLSAVGANDAFCGVCGYRL